MIKSNEKANNGFTLVELLAVIFILGLIIIIAVPKVMDTLNNSKKRTFELTVKSIVKSAEEKYLENEAYGIEEEITCDSVSNITSNDFSSCKIEFDEEGNALVSIEGKGRYKGLYVCNGTKKDASAQIDECGSGGGNPDSSVAMYSYNGVKLPDINTVWTDKENQPHVVIANLMNTSNSVVATLVAYCDVPFYTTGFTDEDIGHDVNKGMICYSDDSFAGCTVYVLSDGSWALYGNISPDDDGFVTMSSFYPVWSNHDIYNYNQPTTIYLSASEPVPVYE